MDEVLKIVNDIKQGNIKPVYFLMGEETYFIDKLSEYIENNILSEEEKEFNQMTLYGRDVTIENIISSAKRYPIMSDRQVVIVKEAQDLSRTIDKLENYLQNPQLTTVLVFCYNYKTVDKRKKWIKILEQKGVLFESKKLYENQVADWIKRMLSGKNYYIEPEANGILVAFLGTDLTKISNELDKLQLILPKGSTITPKIIEDNIGFSKDYNNFELRKAISERNQLKAYQIVKYFSDNSKDNPIIVTTSIIFSFFSQLLQYQVLKDKSKANVAKVLKINSYFLKDYDIAAYNYPMKKVSQIISTLRNIDVKSKGVGANGTSQFDLSKEMLTNIFK